VHFSRLARGMVAVHVGVKPRKGEEASYGLES
jgi:hypothetical protein